MKDKLISFLQAFNILQERPRLLLAVSGGADSMVMVHLFHSLGFPCIIAHCNFLLRGPESMQDERFVREQAAVYGFPTLVRRFRTRYYAEKHGISVQMAARELRYRWFREAAQEQHCTYIATAHHAGDQAETFFVNLLRGTGIKGLQSMPVIQGDLLRPLLFATREEILQYASDRNVPFRDDSSNDELYYLRNRIRHRIIPLLEKTRPGFSRVLQRNMQRLQLENHLLGEQLARLLPGTGCFHPDGFRIDIPSLKQSGHPELILLQLLEPAGFSFTQVLEITQALEKQAGKTWKSPAFRLVKDRTSLLVNPYQDKEEAPAEAVLVRRQGNRLVYSRKKLPFTLAFSIHPAGTDFPVEADPRIALLDIQTLTFPLKLRRWEPGDRFRPLGMNRMKKISDYLTDEKTSLPEKEKTWLLLSEEQVTWIVGKRIDDRFRITGKTREVLRISLSGT